MQRLEGEHHDVVKDRVAGCLDDHSMEGNVGVAELLIGQVGSGLSLKCINQLGKMIGCTTFSRKAGTGCFEQTSTLSDLGEREYLVTHQERGSCRQIRTHLLTAWQRHEVATGHAAPRPDQILSRQPLQGLTHRWT